MAHKHLITGGYGFIGSNLANFLGKAWGKDELHIMDPVTPGVSNGAHVSAPHKHIEQSTNDLVASENPLDGYATIFHLGAESHVGRSHEDPARFFEANVYGTFRLLEAVRAVPVQRRPRVVMMSTDEVFGDIGKGDEDADTHFWNHGSKHNPRNPYAGTKAAGDMLAMSWAESFGINLTIVHCCNAFGPNQSDDKLIPRIVKAGLSGQPMKLYGDGSQMREWIYVDDVCEGLRAVSTMGRAAGKRVAFCTGMRVANKAMVDVVRQVMATMRVGQAFEVEHTNDRPLDDLVYGLVPSPQLTGSWKPKVNLGDGLKRTVEWFESGKVSERSPLILPSVKAAQRG